jgi:hypothetical protein
MTEETAQSTNLEEALADKIKHTEGVTFIPPKDYDVPNDFGIEGRKAPDRMEDLVAVVTEYLHSPILQDNFGDDERRAWRTRLEEEAIKEHGPEAGARMNSLLSGNKLRVNTIGMIKGRLELNQMIGNISAERTRPIMEFINHEVARPTSDEDETPVWNTKSTEEKIENVNSLSDMLLDFLKAEAK